MTAGSNSSHNTANGISEAREGVADLVLRTDDVAIVDEAHPDSRHRNNHECYKIESLEGSADISPPRRLSLKASGSPRPSVTELVFTEAAAFYDMFGFLGIPMVIVFVLSAAWTFTLAYIQVHATEMANLMMNTTNFDNGEFWQLPRPDEAVVISSAVMLSLFGIGYTSLVILMLFFHRRTSHSNKALQSDKISAFGGKLGNALNNTADVGGSLVVEPNTANKEKLHTFLAWVTGNYDLFFAVFAPLVVLVYFIQTFQFNRAEFTTKMETIQGGSFDTVARLFGDPSQISSFCNAFHYLQFSSGSSLFFKSALNLLSLYKWRKIITTLIHSHHERRIERERKVQVQPLPDEEKPRSRAQSLKCVVTRKFEAPAWKPKFGKHFVPKVMLSLIFFVAGSAIFVYSIGSVRSSKAVCSKFDQCVVASHRWTFGAAHCPCLVFADRQTAPRTFAEWTDPKDISFNLSALAYAGELRIIQIINRAVPELPVELKNCHHLEQLILIYTKTLRLPTWMSEFRKLEYFHLEGDYTSKRLQVVPAGIFDHMPDLTFIHFGGIPDVEELPSFSSLKNLRYLALAILNSLKELPSFEGLSKLTDLNIVEATRAKTLPSLTPLVSLKSLGIRYRSGVCCNGFIKGTCDTTSFQCVPKAGEPYPMTCTSERVSDADKAILDMYDATAICPNWFPYNLEAAAPTKYTSDDLCDKTLYKECYLNGVQGICYNTRMMVISCVTQTTYIKMRQLQIERKVGDACNVTVEAWLGCK
ncbi:unnamed protein product [Phytophthora fragariaefolia]|uniref:Unnamed protein product n=1 Tax=Phytophthora fragariaefolia TaxID=1490495 RepID=A0A9W6YMZ1_9STRA|nr:unnamed protein product [Phytophthora fragariaefolia]